jgi:hypothetical protein
MALTLELLLGAGILAVLVTQLITTARSVIGALIPSRRERKGLLRLLYTEVAQNESHISYVASLLGDSDSARSALAMRGRYVSSEALKAVRVPLSQSISSKDFAVLSDYYKNVLLLEEVVTEERLKRDKDAAYETIRDTIDKTKLLLRALSEQGSEVQKRIRRKVRNVTSTDKYAELVQEQDVQKQELPKPPNSK